MSAAERHKMDLVATHPSGAQEWHCSACTRKIVIHHEVDRGLLKTMVLDEGERTVPHSGMRHGRGQDITARTELAVSASPEVESMPSGYLPH